MKELYISLILFYFTLPINAKSKVTTTFQQIIESNSICPSMLTCKSNQNEFMDDSTNVLTSVQMFELESKARTFTIVHNGNMGALFDEVKLPKGQEGMLTRLYDYLEKERKENKVFFLNVGNSHMETFVHKALSYHILSQIMSQLKPDALTIGAKSFIETKEEIFDFIKTSNHTFLSCNLNSPFFLPYKTFPLNDGISLVVIGYISTKISDLDLDLDPIQAIKDTLNSINLNKKIVVVMGCSDDETEKEISKINGVDVIIGETSLINANNYPIKLIRSNKNVYILRTSSVKKLVGLFKATFDKFGNITSVLGKLTDMTAHKVTSRTMSDMLRVLKPVMEQYEGEVIARSRVNFNPQCRRYECNLGNLITDAFVEYKASQFNGPFWTDTPIGIINAGSIKEGINLDLKNGEITRADILQVLPRKEFLVSLTVTGASLYSILEHGMKNGETQEYKGSFLQVSGLHVICNRSMPAGSRVEIIRARCAKCAVPAYRVVDKQEEYRIITNEFLAKGEDGYKQMKEAKNIVQETITDVDAVILYVQKYRIITTEVGERLGSIAFLEGCVFLPNYFIIVILCMTCLFR